MNLKELLKKIKMNFCFLKESIFIRFPFNKSITEHHLECTVQNCLAEPVFYLLRITVPTRSKYRSLKQLFHLLPLFATSSGSKLSPYGQHITAMIIRESTSSRPVRGITGVSTLLLGITRQPLNATISI